MKLQGSIDLFHYWNRLRNGRPAPQRTEIEPADIKSLLADTFILELDTRGVPVFRLAGTRLCATYGRELKGFAFASMWDQRDQKVVSRLCSSVFHDKAVVSISYIGRTESQRENGFELLLLPLEGGRESLRALGIATSRERPFWLGAEAIRENAVQTVRVVDPDRESPPPSHRATIDVPSLEPGDRYLNPLDPFSGSGRRIRHLVVFEGGRGE
jgi:hypothetical protein